MTLPYPAVGSRPPHRLTPEQISGFARVHSDPAITAKLQARDARIARRALVTGSILLTLRATVVPPILRAVLESVPPGERARFDAYTDPAALYVAAGLAIAFLALALLARRKPLLASGLATLVFVAVSVPFLIAHPTLIGGGHLGRITMLLVLGRALTAGFCARFR